MKIFQVDSERAGNRRDRFGKKSPTQSTAFAAEATWNLSPGSGNWNTQSNRTSTSMPNTPADMATFAVSNTTSVL